MVAIRLAEKRKARCLVVCPAYLVQNWGKEILKWASPGTALLLIKKGKEIPKRPVRSPGFIVISYGLLQKAPHLFAWAEQVVADEIHHLKNMAAKRSQAFHQGLYENGAKYFHGLTGTPIKNRVKEFYSLMALAYYDPKFGEAVPEFLRRYQDEISFAERFSYPVTFEMNVEKKNGAKFKIPVTNYKGIRNKDELKHWLDGRYLRVRATNEDLPPISYNDVQVSDTPDVKLLDAFKAFFSGEQDASADRETRTRSVLPEHKRNAALKKVPFTIAHAENLLEQTSHLLIYSDHREPCELLAAHFGVPAVTGSMPASRRAKLVQEFQASRTGVLCATIGALKEGADLFRAKHLILNDCAWVPGDILQVVNRMRALGEKEPRVVHRILGSPQDAAIWAALEAKQKVIEEATT